MREFENNPKTMEIIRGENINQDKVDKSHSGANKYGIMEVYDCNQVLFYAPLENCKDFYLTNYDPPKITGDKDKTE